MPSINTRPKTRPAYRPSAGNAFLAALALLFLAAGAAPVRADVQSTAQGIRFSYKDPYAGQVALAGDFNAWSNTANPMRKDDDGVWSTTVQLGPGEHQYKFVVDGQWIADPGNPVTGGDFGNSMIQVGQDGKLVEMKATSNTELSPKVYVDSRYIVLMKDQRTRGANPEWSLRRPNFDIDLDFQIRVNEDLSAHVLTNINNENQNVQLWETALNFDRGSMFLQNEDINLVVFDNDSVGTWNDPLHLIGDVGIYHHSWGYHQQGVTAWRQFGNYQAQFLYSDNFNSGGTDSPGLEPVFNSLVDSLSADSKVWGPGSSAYSVNRSDNNKNVLGLRVTGPVAGNLSGGLSYRLDRGFNPGALAEIQTLTESDGTATVTFRTYPGSVESWQAGGGDLHYRSEPQGIDLYGEFLVGENWISTGDGDRRQGNVNLADTTVSGETVIGSAVPEAVRLNTSRRFKVGGEYFAYRGWHWTGSVNFQDADLVDRTGPGRSRYNRMTRYSAGLRFDGREWMEWPWEAGLSLDIWDFTYGDRSRWTDQFWFDNTNFWLEQGEHQVTVDRLVMLGGRNVVSWKPEFRWTFYRPRNASVGYRGVLNSTELGRKPKYWGNDIVLHVDLTRRLGLNTDSRIARYDDPVLNLRDTYTSHFVELKYRFTPDLQVGLSWGVDPWVIDTPTNEYAHIGRDVFLFDRGANGDAAKTQFLNMTNTIRSAEQALEDERVVQLEAILTF